MKSNTKKCSHTWHDITVHTCHNKNCHHSDPRIKKPVLICDWETTDYSKKTGFVTWKCQYCNDSIFIDYEDSYNPNEEKTLTKPCPKRN